MHPFVAELVGTLLLVLLGNGVVANVELPRTKANNAGWIVITFGWGMAVFVAVWCVGDISGGHINPAVTVGLAAAGEFPWSDVAPYVAAQMLGGIAGAALVFLFYRDHYALGDDADAKLATFATMPAIRHTSSNLLSEAVGTAVLVLAVLLAVDPALMIDSAANDAKMNGAATSGAPDAQLELQPTPIGLGTLGALPIGLLVFSIGLSLGGTTGYAINPARDLGPRIAHALLPVPNKRDSDWGYAWVPVFGPILGGLAAAALYSILT